MRHLAVATLLVASTASFIIPRRLPSFSSRRFPAVLKASATVSGPDMEVFERASAEIEEIFAGERDQVKEVLRAAWEESWEDQATEIAELEGFVEGSEYMNATVLKKRMKELMSMNTTVLKKRTREAKAALAPAEQLDYLNLWALSGNATEGTERERGREITQTMMQFWRAATRTSGEFEVKVLEREEKEMKAISESDLSRDKVDELIDVMKAQSRAEREKVAANEGARERLRLLKRHQRAGVVEHRIFGEVLSRSSAVTLPATPILGREAKWRFAGVAANQTRWFEVSLNEEESKLLMEIYDEYAENTSSSVDDANEFPSWFPGREQAQWLSEGFDVEDPNVTASDVDMYTWARVLGITLRRSSRTKWADEDDEDVENLFPVVLFVLTVLRLGHSEAVAIYSAARILGRRNAEMLARYEGFDAPVFPDQRVAEAETTSTVAPILMGVFNGFTEELRKRYREEPEWKKTLFEFGLVLLIPVATLLLVFGVLPLVLVGVLVAENYGVVATFLAVWFLGPSVLERSLEALGLAPVNELRASSR